jgi:uncharacterized protein DUF6703
MSDQMLRRLANGGRTGVFLGAIVLVLIALFLPGWAGAIVLTVIVAAMGWLLSKTWPVAAPRTRTMRALILLVLAALAVAKVV